MESKHDFFDKAMYKWFMNVRELNVPVGGHIIREKASDVAKELDIADFKTRSVEKQTYVCCIYRRVAKRKGEGGGLPHAQLKQVQFALNIKHALFDAMS